MLLWHQSNCFTAVECWKKLTPKINLVSVSEPINTQQVCNNAGDRRGMQEKHGTTSKDGHERVCVLLYFEALASQSYKKKKVVGDQKCGSISSGVMPTALCANLVYFFMLNKRLCVERRQGAATDNRQLVFYLCILFRIRSLDLFICTITEEIH